MNALFCNPCGCPVHAPPLGASPRLGMPAVRHCSVGPPRSAIHGRVAATPTSMPGCPLRNTCLRPAWFNGAPKIKIKSQIKSQIKSRATATAMPKPGREAPFPCGSCLALRGCDSGVSDNIKASSAGAIAGKPAPTGECSFPLWLCCCSVFDLAFDLDLRRPVKPRWPQAGIAQWAPRHGCRGRRDTAMDGRSRRAHGAMPDCGHAEPRRGTEWWGKSALVTFALLESDPP